MNKKIATCALGITFCLAGPARARKEPEVRRLSPQAEASSLPKECRIITILRDSPAQKAGLVVGQTIHSVNGSLPADASQVNELITKSPEEASLGIAESSGTQRQVKVHLNKDRPRLGAVCDLTGWRKSGISSAGNESVTIFQGPYALTLSGILDKGLAFLRVRITNNSDHSLSVDGRLFTVADGHGNPLAVMTPLEVMCYLYGDKGAQLLRLKKRKKDTLDMDTAPREETFGEASCAGTARGRLSGESAQYGEANAVYVAEESLWPTTLATGQTADGLIYVAEPSALPLSIKALVDGHTLSASFALPQASDKRMKQSEVIRFLEAQKRGIALRLTLKKGKVFVGKFSSWDPTEERAWFDTPSGGLLNSTSYPLTSILSVEAFEPVPAKPAPVSSEFN